MHSRIARLLLLLFALTPARAAEGKWTPQQLLQFDPAALERMGEKDSLELQSPVLIQVGKRRFVRVVPT